MKKLLVGACILAGLAFAPAVQAMPVGTALEVTASELGQIVSPARWRHNDRGMHRGWTRGHHYGWGRGRGHGRRRG